MLLNTCGEVPKEFFIFADQCIPMTWHNLTFTRRFTSGAYAQCFQDQRFADRYAAGEVDYLPFVPNDACDLTACSAY